VISVLNRVNSAMAWVGIISVMLLVLLIARDVFMRYVLNSASGWMLEVAMGIQLLYGFFCAAFVLKEGGHVGVRVLTDRVSHKTRSVMFLINSIMGIFICGAMAYYCWLMTQASYRMKEITTLLGYPVFLLKLTLVIGFALLGLQFIAEAYKYGQLLKKGDADKV